MDVPPRPALSVLSFDILSRNYINDCDSLRVMSERPTSAYRTILTGECDHCRWEALATSYPELVEMYHDHLREYHPAAWVRA